MEWPKGPHSKNGELFNFRHDGGGMRRIAQSCRVALSRYIIVASISMTKTSLPCCEDTPCRVSGMMPKASLDETRGRAKGCPRCGRGSDAPLKPRCHGTSRCQVHARRVQGAQAPSTLMDGKDGNGQAGQLEQDQAIVHKPHLNRSGHHCSCLSRFPRFGSHDIKYFRTAR